jgi:hypothetical protein
MYLVLFPLSHIIFLPSDASQYTVPNITLIILLLEEKRAFYHYYCWVQLEYHYLPTLFYDFLEKPYSHFSSTLCSVS